MDFVKFIEKHLILNMVNFKNLKWLLPIASGVFLVLSSPPFNISFLLFFSFLPLFVFLNYKNDSLKQYFLGGFIVGFIFFGQIFSWFFDVLVSSLVDIKSEVLSFFIVFLLWLVFTIISASFVGFFSLSYRYFKNGKIWNILLIPSLWIIFEYLRAWISWIFMAGPEFLFGPHWTFGNLGYNLVGNIGFRSLVGIGGMYFISFLIVFINILFFFLIKKIVIGEKKIWSWNSFRILLILILIIVSYFFAFPVDEDKKNKTLTVAMLQTEFSSSFSSLEDNKQTEAEIQNQLLEIISQHSPVVDIILLPEGINILKREDYKEYLFNLFENKDILIINSGENKEGKFVGIFYSNKDGFLGRYEKRLLIPYGDYFPYMSEFIAKIINKEWLSNFKEVKNRKKGTETLVLPVFEKTKMSLFFCSEAASSNIHRELALKGSEIFLNSGSLAFAEGSKVLDSQTQSVLQMRAAENGRYLIRATNYGSSYVLNDRGDFINISDNFRNQIIFGEVRSISQKTFYTKNGDWILFLSSFFILGLALIHGSKRIRKRF